MTRARVRLLGPCFKTGRIGCRRGRHRPCVHGRSSQGRSHQRSNGTASSPAQSKPATAPQRPPRAAGIILGPPSRPTTDVCNTGPRGVRLPSAGAHDGPGTGRGAPPAESAPLGPPKTRTPVRPYGRSEGTAQDGSGEVEFRGRTLRSYPFASKRFHVLLNSLFKVLFNFPSRYLSAIGLVSVFSLRWSLPPTLGCILKQPDSGEAQRHGRRRRRGLTPATGEAPIRRTRTAGGTHQRLSQTPQFPSAARHGGFGAGLFPLHSPLLWESLLVSFPPLSDMLKFSG